MKENLINGLNLSLNTYSVGCIALVKAIREVVIDITHIKDVDEYVSCIVNLNNSVLRVNKAAEKKTIIGVITHFNGKYVSALTDSGKEIDLNDLDGNTLFEIVKTLISQYSNKENQQEEEEDFLL